MLSQEVVLVYMARCFQFAIFNKTQEIAEETEKQIDEARLGCWRWLGWQVHVCIVCVTRVLETHLS